MEKSNFPRVPQKVGVLVAQVLVEGRVDQNPLGELEMLVAVGLYIPAEMEV